MAGKTAISGIQSYWIALERALFEPIEGETIVDRLAKRPWGCDSPAVKKAWDDLTHPNNFQLLKNWASEPMNASSREITDEAIKVCNARIAKARAGKSST
ncbi:MAG: hypothetical protein FD180_2474 [Planctomycetota bacterium]|nr:MAG: hypothetical protein FD180_2474 [Planctomycetota bacterium]